MSEQAPRTSKRFEIEVVKDRVVHEVHMTPVKNEATGHVAFVREERKVKYPESYNVYFPGGHSIWVASKGDLVRLGLTPDENFEIDLDTGLPVIPPQRVSIKDRVQRATRNTRDEG